MSKKMVNLSIEETSGVDHPAHLHEGWLVVKSADVSTVNTLLDTLTSNLMKEDEMSELKATNERLTEALEALAKAEERIEELETTPEASDAPAEATEDSTDAPTEDAPAEEAATDEEAAPAEEASDEDILKSAPEAVVKMVEAVRAEKAEAVAKAAAAESALRKERDERADAEAVAKAREQFGSLAIDAEKVAPALRRLASIDADLAKSLEDALSVANGQMESANIFAEIGKSKSGTSGTAWEQIEAIAKSKFEGGLNNTLETAMADALAENPALYNEYLSEKGAK